MKKITCSFFVLSVFLCACGAKNGELAYAAAVEADVYDEEYVKAPFDDEEIIVTMQPREEDMAGDISPEVLADGYNRAISSIKTDKSASLKKKIIKDGDITIQTNDIAASKKGIDNLVKSLNAYYYLEDLDKGNYKISYKLIIRVPAENFEKLVSSVEQGKDEIKNKSIRVRDVTEEYMDITTRLSSKKEYLKQYTVLLSRAAKITDILEIQEKIRKLHEEIESAEGRLRYLNDQVTFSTLNVSLEKEIEYVYKPQPKNRFIERVKSGLSTGWDIIVEIVLFLINIWSVLLILIAAFFFVRRIRKKRKTRKNG